MAEKKSKVKKLSKKLLYKYRLVVLNEDTFEEHFSFKLNRLNVFILSTIFAIFLIVLTTVLIAFTPIREYIPGYSSSALKKKAINLSFKTDSLEQLILVNEQYLASVKKILSGDIKTENFNKDSILKVVNKEIAQGVNLAPSKEDSLLRERVAQEDKYNPLVDNKELNLVLFPPVKGVISEDYNPDQKHYAVDVVTEKDSPVKATADGTVVFAEWTVETGYVIIIKHAKDLLSVYKHNAQLNKDQADFVKAGEIIAIAGNTGELTTGTHLHFELWSEGLPINPNNFIDFD